MMSQCVLKSLLNNASKIKSSTFQSSYQIAFVKPSKNNHCSYHSVYTALTSYVSFLHHFRQHVEHQSEQSKLQA